MKFRIFLYFRHFSKSHINKLHFLRQPTAHKYCTISCDGLREPLYKPRRRLIAWSVPWIAASQPVEDPTKGGGEGLENVLILLYTDLSTKCSSRAERKTARGMTSRTPHPGWWVQPFLSAAKFQPSMPAWLQETGTVNLLFMRCSSEQSYNLLSTVSASDGLKGNTKLIAVKRNEKWALLF